MAQVDIVGTLMGQCEALETEYRDLLARRAKNRAALRLLQDAGALPKDVDERVNVVYPPKTRAEKEPAAA